jgi:asparagine synthase (glutamine-hydrolysing)
MSSLEPDAITELFQEPVSLEELYSEAICIWENNAKASSVDRMLEFFTRLYLQDDILTKVDRATMMVSLESRAIFLDNDLVDFCRRLPARFKYRNGIRKYLLKKAVAPLLPDRVVRRRKKGFGMPIAEWLRSMPPTPPATSLAGMDGQVALRYWREHRHGMGEHRLFLWCWLAAQYALARSEDCAVRGAAA